MKIASLMPACTEWVASLGALDNLVARSHACDYPPEVKDVPVATSVAKRRSDSKGTLGKITDAADRDASLLEIDVERLAALNPDLILTQPDRIVGEKPFPELVDEIARQSGHRPSIFSVQPATFKQALNDALRLGSTIGKAREAMAFLAARERRLQALRDRLEISKTTSSDALPSIIGFEWLDPIMTAGCWIPDMIELAGGRMLANGPGTPSRCIEWEHVLRLNPDVLAVFPRGFELGATRSALRLLTGRPGWRDLKAVRSGRVFAFDGKQYFHRPGPRLYRGVELLALALHADKFETRVEEWEMAEVRTASRPVA